MNTESPKAGGPGGCLARLFWMAIGNIVLLLTGIAISQNHGGFALTIKDAIFWITAGALLAVRYVDIHYLNGQTADNRAVTPADWRRYVATVLSLSMGIWLLAHLF